MISRPVVSDIWVSRNSHVNFKTGFLEEVKLDIWFQGVLILSNVPVIQERILIISEVSMCCKVHCKNTVMPFFF